MNPRIHPEIIGDVMIAMRKLAEANPQWIYAEVKEHALLQVRNKCLVDSIAFIKSLQVNK